MGGRELQRAGRHRRPQDRARDRGRDPRPRTPSSASASWCSRRRSTACRASSRPASALALGPVVEESRALTIYWDGTTQDGVDEKLPNPKYLFRTTDNECEAVMSSLLAIKHWKGQFISRRRHQPGLFLRPQQHGGVRRAAQALQHRARGRHRAVAQGRHHGADQPRRRAQGRQARPDLLLAAVRRSAGVHEAGACRGADQGHQAGVPGGRLAAHADEEGLHAGRHAVRPQHALLRQPAGDADGEGIRRLVRPTSTRTIPNWEADRAYFAIASYKAAVEKAQGRRAAAGRRRRHHRRHGRPVGRKPRRQGLLAQGPHRRPDLRAGPHHPQQQVRLRHARDSSRPCIRPTCRSRPARTSGSG